MEKVYVARDPAEAHFIKGLLEQAHIQTMIKDEGLFVIRGGGPMDVPSLWVNTEDAETAREIIAELYTEPETEESWTCTECGEVHPLHFDTCWKCGATHTAA
ncbi:MAG TPA: DUF2007 domain-containing protein [Chloroflexi bacterium]|nr:DUF2007 domain-containing protein [Chloroflexota bacterium]